MTRQSGANPEASTGDVPKMLRLLAEQGYVEAQYQLGWTLRYTGTNEYAPDRVERLKRFATLGHDLCQLVLGTMYECGRGVSTDPAEAVKWYRLAAAQREPTAEFHLGRMYSRGEGVRKNRAMAIKWFQRAAQQGHTEARHALKELEATRNAP